MVLSERYGSSAEVEGESDLSSDGPLAGGGGGEGRIHGQKRCRKHGSLFLSFCCLFLPATRTVQKIYMYMCLCFSLLHISLLFRLLHLLLDCYLPKGESLSKFQPRDDALIRAI